MTNDGDTKAALRLVARAVSEYDQVMLTSGADDVVTALDLITTTLSEQEAEHEKQSAKIEMLRERNDALITDRNAANERLSEQEAELERYREALKYAASPTIGLPGGRDPEDFVDEASESNVRLGLKASIRIARSALTQDSPEEGP